MQYRVVYGETIPAWEKVFDAIKEAITFARRCAARGDIVFSIAAVDQYDTAPHSLQAAIENASRPK
jgi:hypothetical protein